MRDNENPVIMAYDGHHYESIAPKTNEDCKRSIKLVENFKNGEYKLGQSDIIRLINLNMVETIQHFTSY